MPAPVTGETLRTGTPDGTLGARIFDIPLQENSSYKAVAGIHLSDQVAAVVSPDRSALSADDTTTTDMSAGASGFALASGTGLVPIYNRGALAVWCTFASGVGVGAAVIEPVFYDASGTPLFVGEQLSFAAKTQRVTSSGNYMSQVQLCDTYGASKYRLFTRSKGSGNVDVYGHPI